MENYNCHIGLLKIAFEKFSIDGVMEWDQLLRYATAVFNCFPMSTLRNHHTSYILDVTPI